MDLHHAGKLTFFGDLAGLSDAEPFAAWLAPSRKTEWVVYATPPFGGPKAVPTYLSRYTHRVAISNTRLVSADAETVAFRWRDDRIKSGIRQKVMRLATPEFIRRFLIHVLPPLSADCFAIACRAMDGFHRIRHYGLLANTTRKANIRTIRALLCVLPPEQVAAPETEPQSAPLTLRAPCPAVAAPCGSSRSSDAGKNRCRAHHQGSRRHDTSLVSRHGKRPAALRGFGPNGVWLFISSVTKGGHDTETHSLFGIPRRPHERIGHHAQLPPQH